MKGEYSMPRSEASKKQQYEYALQYRKENIVRKLMIFNKTNSNDLSMLEWLNSRPEGTSPYLKRLVQEDMSRSASEKAKVDQ